MQVYDDRVNGTILGKGVEIGNSHQYEASGMDSMPSEAIKLTKMGCCYNYSSFASTNLPGWRYFQKNINGINTVAKVYEMLISLRLLEEIEAHDELSNVTKECIYVCEV